MRPFPAVSSPEPYALLTLLAVLRARARTGQDRSAILFLGHEAEHHPSDKYYPMLAEALGRDASTSTTTPRSRRRWAMPIT